MKHVLATFAFLLCALAAQPAHAWLHFPNAQVRDVTQWENNNPVFFKTSGSETHCYVPAAEKNLVALILSLHASQRTASIHCYPDNPISVGGVTGYRLHRIIAH